MPEYLAPGVYVEETSFRSKSIEGVSTTTTGFVGPTRYGPTDGEPELITSFNQFERIYGGLDPLKYDDKEVINYLAHAVRGFFDNGGSRLYIARTYTETANNKNGKAVAVIPSAGQATDQESTAEFIARFPGAMGNMRVIVTGRLTANVLEVRDSSTNLSQVRDGDLVVIQQPGENAHIYSARFSNNTWSMTGANGTVLENWESPDNKVYPLKLTIQIEMPGKFSQPMLWDNLTISDLSTRSQDSLSKIFADSIPNRLQELETPLILKANNLNSAELAGNLIGVVDWNSKLTSSDGDVPTGTKTFILENGNDGKLPTPKTYEGAENTSTGVKSGLKSFEDLEDISIVAAPGYSHSFRKQDDAQQISQCLISHCETMRYRVAILDSPEKQAVSGIREYRALLDSTRVALYYPWLRILDPVTNQQISVPPSGFVAGIYARNDVEIGVHKAPANEVVRGAIGLEMLINKGQQDVLNPLGINCIRFFENRGIRVWGARTTSSDPEWKYLNIRRYFAYLQRSVDRSTQWAVFEPNGDQLWANVRRSVESFLENEWKEGRLAGAKVEDAFFVRCDRSTMTQNDIDNGRMICLIGVAPLYPAEFVIFRIGQWTANARR